MAKEINKMASAWGVATIAYDRFSEDFGDALFHCIQRLNPKAGETVLDVATGTGWAARLAAQRNAKVTGCDFSDGQILAARHIAERAGLDIAFDVGDANQLPYANGSFDAVMSTFGIIFSGQPEVAASELARVCRPGGRLALSVWTSDGTIAALAKEVIAKFSPPPSDPPPPSPFSWGSEARLKQLFDETFELKFEHASTILRIPDGEALWQFWNETHGPTITRMETLDAQVQAEFKGAFVAFHERYKTDLGIAMPREYIIAVGERRP